MEDSNEWQNCNSETFWREVAPCSHVVQLYENEISFLNLLEDFIAGGISVDDSVIVIATKAHLAELRKRLEAHGLNIDTLHFAKRYIPLDADEVLAKFMRNGCPDYSLFVETISKIFDQLRESNRKVRAFGEMVAILWAQGNSAATVMLEHLWNSYFEKETFSLFCAYPKNIFPTDATSTLSHICKAHSKMITNSGTSRFDLSYQDLNNQTK